MLRLTRVPFLIVIFCLLRTAQGVNGNHNNNNNNNTETVKKHRCSEMATIGAKIEKNIKECLNDVRSEMIRETLEQVRSEYGNDRRSGWGWDFAEPTGNFEDRRIAGCLLQCVYHKNNAVDFLGWPRLEGLVALYTEGVNDRDFFLATLHTADKCVKTTVKKYTIQKFLPAMKGEICDIAYDLFDCVSDNIASYCSDSQLHSSTV